MNELKPQLETEKDHSAFLERLLKALYGEGWNKLTLHEAKKWRERHLTSQSSEREYSCSCLAVKRIGVGKYCPDCGGRNSRR